MIGEIRDLETAEIALHAAMTGHVVLTTVHAQSAAAALVRLRDFGIAEASLGTSVRSVLSQRLLRRPCEHCHKGERVSVDDLARIRPDPSLELYRPAGCHRCGFTGYAGRVGLHEISRSTMPSARPWAAPPRLSSSPRSRAGRPPCCTNRHAALRGRRDERRRDRARARRARLRGRARRRPTCRLISLPCYRSDSAFT